MVVADRTSELYKKTYWASYNIPYVPSARRWLAPHGLSSCFSKAGTWLHGKALSLLRVASWRRPASRDPSPGTQWMVAQGGQGQGVSPPGLSWACQAWCAWTLPGLRPWCLQTPRSGPRSLSCPRCWNQGPEKGSAFPEAQLGTGKGGIRTHVHWTLEPKLSCCPSHLQCRQKILVSTPPIMAVNDDLGHGQGRVSSVGVTTLSPQVLRVRVQCQRTAGSGGPVWRLVFL